MQRNEWANTGVPPYRISPRPVDAVLCKTSNGKIANLTLRQASGGTWYAIDISQGMLELEDCDISSQGWTCVAIRSGASPRLCRNSIHNGKASGVLVYDNGQETLEDNKIFANTVSGVEIKSGSSLTLRRNRIFQNGDAGILVHSGGSGIFADNDLRGNVKGAWNIDLFSKLLVQRRGNKE